MRRKRAGKKRDFVKTIIHLEIAVLIILSVVLVVGVTSDETITIISTSGEFSMEILDLGPSSDSGPEKLTSADITVIPVEK